MNYVTKDHPNLWLWGSDYVTVVDVDPLGCCNLFFLLFPEYYRPNYSRYLNPQSRQNNGPKPLKAYYSTYFGGPGMSHEPLSI